jgi:hypothetical protein
LILVLVGATAGNAADREAVVATRRITDFTEPDPGKGWVTSNDNGMGVNRNGELGLPDATGAARDLRPIFDRPVRDAAGHSHTFQDSAKRSVGGSSVGKGRDGRYHIGNALPQRTLARTAPAGP